ncbi:MAG: hypothetical protein K2Y13_13590 [Burkholderiaceae bacterium]|uniref:Membrane-bound lysozyme inhibitor of c-type lysozyme MliC n=1 Tax=Herminiimonas contaminans TaxID=1111140 RepID=A0ABS0ET94_9BURK|nr:MULTISPECIES: hypothetical protein [Oxalobacteraceae]MBF8177269.1 hypothetical protein [Herminiimonas contaminans]MBX9800486.1 hypothetical protein [Burkholderiaceae bacterium]
MKKLLCAFLLIGMSSAIAPAFAQSAAGNKEAAKKPAAKVTKKAPAKAAAAATPAAAAAAGEDEQEDLGEANIEGSTVTHYNCELGNKITTYNNVGDDKYMAIRWQNKVHRLGRIGTSTGANRFENRKAGLVWINIPSKAMLLDSRKGQQLANECRNPEQAKALAAKG